MRIQDSQGDGKGCPDGDEEHLLFGRSKQRVNL